MQVTGAVGATRPETLKISVGYRAGFRCEAEISYVGPGCVDRARLAGDIVGERLRRFGIEPRVDLIGTLDDPNHAMNSECRLRVAAMAPVADYAEQVGREVEALYLNGPAGGGGVRTAVTDVVGIVSHAGAA